MNVRRALLAGCVVAAVLTAPGAAYGEEPPVGGWCALTTADGDDREIDALIVAGPVAGTGTLTCTVQVADPEHGGTAVASASASGAGVVTLEPTRVSYPQDYWQYPYVCTTFTSASGTTWYPGQGATWTTDPGFGCHRELPGPRSVLRAYDELCDVDACLPWISLDPLLCPIFGSFSGTVAAVRIDSDGDAWLDGERAWDCPPYDD